MPYLSIVIPCYNEETNLSNKVLEQVASYLQKQNYQSEVIIVDDGSSDNSAKIIDIIIKKYPNFNLIKNFHQGKAYAVSKGVYLAKGKFILFSDLDQATPIKEIEKMLPFLEQDYDVVIGSRKSERKGAPLLRLIMARGFMMLRTLILGLKGISDTQCGFKSFKCKAAKEIFKRLKLYGETKKIAKGSLVTAGFDVEVLFVAKELGYKINEVPVEWHYVETRKVNPITDSWHGLTDMIKLRLNKARGLYDQV